MCYIGVTVAGCHDKTFPFKGWCGLQTFGIGTGKNWASLWSGLEQPLNENKTLVDCNPKVSRVLKKTFMFSFKSNILYCTYSTSTSTRLCSDWHYEHYVKKCRLLIYLNRTAVLAQLGCWCRGLHQRHIEMRHHRCCFRFGSKGNTTVIVWLAGRILVAAWVHTESMKRC